MRANGADQVVRAHSSSHAVSQERIARMERRHAQQEQNSRGKEQKSRRLIVEAS